MLQHQPSRHFYLALHSSTHTAPLASFLLPFQHLDLLYSAPVPKHPCSYSTDLAHLSSWFQSNDSANALSCISQHWSWKELSTSITAFFQLPPPSPYFSALPQTLVATSICDTLGLDQEAKLEYLHQIHAFNFNLAPQVNASAHAKRGGKWAQKQIAEVPPAVFYTVPETTAFVI